MEDMKLIMLKAFEKTLESIIDKSGLPALTVYGDDAHLYIRSQSKHRPVVALIQTEFAGQDLMGTGPGASAAACAVCKEDTLPWARDGPGSFFFKFYQLATCIWYSLVHGHDETVRRSRDIRWRPDAACTVCGSMSTGAPSDETKYVQSTAPPVEDSSVQQHHEGQAAADFFDRFIWKETGLKHVPNGREVKTARDGTQVPFSE